MYEIDPTRTDLIEEFDQNPYGHHSPELVLVVNRLRLMPMEERTIIVCTKLHKEWTLAKMPTARGVKLEYYDDLGHCQTNTNLVENVILGGPRTAQKTCELPQPLGD
jgi:hypothetical protein